MFITSNDHRSMIAIADGAGGTGGGSAASRMVCEAVEACANHEGLVDWSQVLCDVDEAIAADHEAGWSTGVIVEVYAGEIRGASVGDSRALLITNDRIEDLTEHQRAKPLLGTTQSLPVYFGPHPVMPQAVILVATDGLFDAVKLEVVQACLDRSNLDESARRLLHAAQLPSGNYSDDVTIALMTS